MSTSKISDVTDTAAWVAFYRAHESQRADALFHDPLAKQLAGPVGSAIAAENKLRGAEWYVVIRTCIIDAYIQEAIASGVGMIVNLGAGLDTRPYRLSLPAELLWIEVDYPKVIETKAAKLKNEKPNCRLERIALDLSQIESRQRLFSELNKRTKKALVLTEGVLPYLTEAQVVSLGRDLQAQARFALWIVDYFSPLFMRVMVRGSRRKQMANAPFQFAPRNWYRTFQDMGWDVHIMKYMAVESKALGRALPYPLFFNILLQMLPSFLRRKLEKQSGFALLKRRSVLD